ncbi:Lnb N-terminal periplasmic domain-containing protein [Psychrobacter sp. DM4]|uniref:Lnb N-terminal periplasmic domain-containing protein n=1 Tax=Psychrobacter sp. DM4 TaxID=3440637 RepID=UPI003F4F887F
MSQYSTIDSNRIAINTKSKDLSLRTRLSCAIVGLLFCIPAQAFLPTPVSLVTTGELAPDVALNESLKPQTAVLNLTANTTLDAGTIIKQEVQSVLNNEAELLLATLRKQVQSDKLAEHITWRRLLYFLDDKQSLFNKSTPKSLIDQLDFFLSVNGQQDASAELDAMLVAIATQMVASQNAMSKETTAQSLSSISSSTSAVCRFPARTQWLTDSLGIDGTRLQADCPELASWMKMLDPEQLSIMFAEEYLDNPISAFGHTLLRIDSPASAADRSQIHHAYALNDTVDGDPDDAFAIYAIRSATGGYNNRIEIDPYPKKLAQYLKDDERDAWTYQLDLTPAEVQQIILHVWETKDLDIPYYFSTDNCASEILRLVDVVRPEQNLLSQLPYVVIPSDVVQLLNDNSLLADARFTPSDSTMRQSELNKAKAAAKLGYQALSKEDTLAIKLAERNPISSISADGKTIIDYGITASNNNPIDRHPFQMGQIGIGQRGDNSYIDVGVRAGFHDMLDRTLGFSQFFNLESLAATVRFYDTNDNNENDPDSIVLENFTVLRGRSFNPVNSAERGKTWGVNIEATRVDDGSQVEGRDHLVGSVGYETGWSWTFGSPRSGTGEMPPQLCYTLLSGTAQAGRGINNGFRVGAGINAGCHYQINNQLRAQAQLQLPYWYHGDSQESDVTGHYWQPITTLGLQYDIDRTQALRLDASYDWQDRVDANDDIKLAYRRYF